MVLGLIWTVSWNVGPKLGMMVTGTLFTIFNEIFRFPLFIVNAILRVFGWVSTLFGMVVKPLYENGTA